MARTAAEAREYQRGYNRAGARHWERLRRVIDIARGYRARLTDASATKTCATCDRWTRGRGAGINASACLWGSCRADFEWSMEPRMWVDADKNTVTEIITQPEFGCVSWIPRREIIPPNGSAPR